MTSVLYTISGSPRGWRVLLGARIKGVELNVRYLSLSDGEHKSDDYLKINPRGRVPSIVAGNIQITDSLAILSWLDQQYPQRPLFGRNPDEHAKIWSATRDMTDALRKAMNALLLPVFFKSVDAITTELQQAADNVMFELGWMDARLQMQDFMAGDHMSAADAIAYPEVRILIRAFETHGTLMTELGFSDLSGKFPRLKVWMERVEAIEGFEKTIPIHWGIN